MADNAHALLDTLIRFRTAMRASARHLKSAIDNAPAAMPPDKRLQEAMRAHATEIRAIAGEVNLAMAALEVRLEASASVEPPAVTG